MPQRMYNQEFNELKLAFMEGIGKTDIEEISFEDSFLRWWMKIPEWLANITTFHYHWEIQLLQTSKQ